jgi:hypothetical protein
MDFSTVFSESISCSLQDENSKRLPRRAILRGADSTSRPSQHRFCTRPISVGTRISAERCQVLYAKSVRGLAGRGKLSLKLSLRRVRLSTPPMDVPQFCNRDGTSEIGCKPPRQ